MGAKMLFKYLDAEGGLKMLEKSNLQFTNATQLNDPFDCHPALIDITNVPPKDCLNLSAEDITSIANNRCERNRDKAWICSLSKVYDSILMWTYYGNHNGVCIGLDMEKVRKDLSQILCSTFIGAMEMDVQYKNIIQKPDYYNDSDIDYYRYQLSTKAEAWKHEKEVRLLLIDPMPFFVPMSVLTPSVEHHERISWKEVRAYPHIRGECFSSLYLGIKMDEEMKNKIVKVALKCNPDIKIYQMKTDPNALKLIGKVYDV